MSETLWAALAEVNDPEMPVNLVDLGVIYGISESNGVVEVDLTFTAMGCPASEFILEDVRERLLREAGVTEVRINVVWNPPWTAARWHQLCAKARRDGRQEVDIKVRRCAPTTGSSS